MSNESEMRYNNNKRPTIMKTQLMYKARMTGVNCRCRIAAVYGVRVARSKYTTREMNNVNEAKFKHIPANKISIPIFDVLSSFDDANPDPVA